MKTITIGGMTLELTATRKRRIIEAMQETQTKLDKELRYSEDLQHKDIVDFYRSHIAKLTAMLS
jgi:aspartate/glutamate racemase